MHAVDLKHKANWTEMTSGQVMLEVRRLTKDVPCLVTLSGGNPALQPLDELIRLGHTLGYEFAMETQGSIAKPWFSLLDHLILSPKPPSSRMPFKPERLRACIEAALDGLKNGSAPGRMWPSFSLKTVVMSEEDYQFARSVHRDFAVPDRIPFFITPGNHTPPAGAQWNSAGAYEFDVDGVLARTRWIAERVAQDGWLDVSIIPQLHTLLWQNQQGI